MQPEVLLLDEPMAGMNLEETEDMARFILDVNEEERWKVTCLLVEHDMDAVFQLADRISVLVYGEVLTTDTPQNVRRSQAVRDAYLGDEAD